MMTVESKQAEVDWERIIQDWEESDLAQPEFCRQRQISYNSFSYQRNKHNKKNKPIKFAKIDIENNAAKTLPDIRIILPNQTQIMIPANRDLLIEVLTALRGLAC